MSDVFTSSVRSDYPSAGLTNAESAEMSRLQPLQTLAPLIPRKHYDD